MRLVYACRFELPVEFGIPEVLNAYRSWVAARYNLQVCSDPPQVPEGHSYVELAYPTADQTAHSLTWEHPFDDDQSIIWRNAIRFLEIESCIALEHTVWIDSVEFVVDLEAENSNLRANQQVLFGAVPEPQQTLAPKVRSPASTKEAVEFARQDFEHLRILPSAEKAAEKSPFLDPPQVYDALSDLNEVAEVVATTGGEIRGLLAERGWGKRVSMHISNTTRTKFGKAYRFELDGKNVLFEPHITLGAGDANTCASIHFLIDKSTSKIAIGHVGRHLPNTKA